MQPSPQGKALDSG